MKPPPGPLEAALLAALRADPPDPAAVEAARVALVRQWDRLAWCQANRWWRRNESIGDVRDYHAAAVLGLWEAAVRFRPERGWVFGTYATWWIRRRVKEVALNETAAGFRAPRKDEFVRVLVAPFSAAPMGQVKDDTTPYEQTIPQPAADPREEPPDAAEVWVAVERVVTHPTELLVLRRRFLEGLTLREVAAEIGRTRARVRQIEARALARLRERGAEFAGFLGG